MGTKSRETIYGASIREAAERAAEASKEADRLAVGLLFGYRTFVIGIKDAGGAAAQVEQDSRCVTCKIARLKHRQTV